MIKQNIKTCVLSIGLLLTLVANNAFSLESVQALSSDSRIKVVAYDPNNVVPITLNLLNSTQFILNQDERVLDVQTGDLAAWSFDDKYEPPNMFFLKPTIANSSTNMTIVTDKRNYYFHLIASPDVSPDNATYVVRMIYPEDEKLKMLQEQASTLNLSKDPSVYHWNYSYNGSREILPLHVFDDGNFTYLELQPGQPVPAVFAVDNAKGHESVVNFRKQGNYLVIERTSPQFTLRQGDTNVVSIFNDDVIHNLSQGN